MTRNSAKKIKQLLLTIKRHYETTQGIKQKIVNLILENTMSKAIIEVYFELLVTNFYAQISAVVIQSL